MGKLAVPPSCSDTVEAVAAALGCHSLAAAAMVVCSASMRAVCDARDAACWVASLAAGVSRSAAARHRSLGSIASFAHACSRATARPDAAKPRHAVGQSSALSPAICAIATRLWPTAAGEAERRQAASPSASLERPGAHHPPSASRQTAIVTTHAHQLSPQHILATTLAAAALARSSPALIVAPSASSGACGSCTSKSLPRDARLSKRKRGSDSRRHACPPKLARSAAAHSTGPAMKRRSASACGA
eukprot:6788590-Prymnesium_polylepis.2